MEKNYVIAWKNLKNARTGVAKTLMEQSEAQRLAEQLNQEHPDFEHIAVHSESKNVMELFSRQTAEKAGLQLHPFPSTTKILPPEPMEKREVFTSQLDWGKIDEEVFENSEPDAEAA